MSVLGRRARPPLRSGNSHWGRLSGIGRKGFREGAPMDEARLQKLVDQVLLDMGAAFGAATVVLGDRLGLWKAMAGAGPLGAGELARRTGTNERLVAEWLAAQAAAG